MRRQTLKATPAMLRRAADLYRPFGHPPVAPVAKRKPVDTKQTEMLADSKSIERKESNPQTK